jgi:hypothetical protein
MKDKSEFNDSYGPIAVIDEQLNKFDHIILFPEKLARANAVLEKYGLPSDFDKNKNIKSKAQSKNKKLTSAQKLKKGTV